MVAVDLKSIPIDLNYIMTLFSYYFFWWNLDMLFPSCFLSLPLYPAVLVEQSFKFEDQHMH